MHEQYLKCDEPDCNHREVVENITENLVGKPCPLCGANLLTQEDHDAFHALSDLVQAVLAVMPKPAEDTGMGYLNYGVHDGAVTMNTKPVEEDNV